MQFVEVTHVQGLPFHCYEHRRLDRQLGWHGGLVAPAGLEGMFFNGGIPLPVGSTTALPPT
jgi:hypothetical protein